MTLSENEYDSDSLLGGRLLPLTGSVLFVEARPDKCVEALVGGKRGARVMALTGFPLIARQVRASGLEELLQHTLPFQSIHERNLFVATSNPAWTAVFENARLGMDPHSMMVWLADAGLRSVSIVDFPNTYDRRTNRGFYGVRKTETYDIGLGSSEMHGHTLGVQIAESGRWAFAEPSAPVPSEYEYDAAARRAPDKFTRAHLARTAANYGLRPFDDDFYAPDLTGIVLEQGGPPDPREKSWTLAEARGY
jgi:hypothetical protein